MGGAENDNNRRIFHWCFGTIFIIQNILYESSRKMVSKRRISINSHYLRVCSAALLNAEAFIPGLSVCALSLAISCSSFGS